MRVALFVTCLVDGMFPDVGKATVAVLERLGVQVDVPMAQTCCGQMHTNTGYAGQALPLVERYADAFAGYDAVVTPSGSCAGSVRHQHAALAERAGQHGLAARSHEVAARTYELSEFLVDVLGVEAVGAN
jgi:L-lactate dehydrogenase complex protein LldE